MSEMVERVARAITIQEGDDPDGHTGSLLNNCELWWEHRIPQARAAIAAMREPTDDMLCAGDESIIEALNDHTGVRRDPTPAEGAWQAMIDEALKS